MVWISSLLKTLCPFCLETPTGLARACAACVEDMSALERGLPTRIEGGTLRVVAASGYEGWMRRLILAQKSRPMPGPTRWLAALLWRHQPQDWRSVPLIWIPGPAFAPPVLVERLALELARLGQPLATSVRLRRRLFCGPPQKRLSLEKRRERDLSRVFTLARRSGDGPSTPRRFVLLDDVFTTGATLAGCASLITRQTGAELVGALALSAGRVNER